MGSEAILQVFAKNKENNTPTFIAFTTCGFPTIEDTPSILLALQKGGADIIEVGVPFTDPLAEGPTIQYSSNVALENGTTLDTVFSVIEQTRSQGLTVPVILMGYYNPFLQYGEAKCVQRTKEVGANGFIIVDLPPGEESLDFRSHCDKHGLSMIPLIAPTTPDSRKKLICETANSFVYCVALSGVTGARAELPPELQDYIERVKQANCKNAPLAVGFGISTREHFVKVAGIADGVVIGSAIIKTIDQAKKNNENIPEVLESWVKQVIGKQ